MKKTKQQLRKQKSNETYRKKNVEKIAKINRAYRKKNAKKIAKSKKKIYEKNRIKKKKLTEKQKKKKHLKQIADWKKANPKKVSSYKKANYANKRDVKLKRNRRNHLLRRQKTYFYLIDYCKTRPCVQCGETNFALLEFDHIDPKTKNYNVCFLAQTGKLELMKKELKLCQVLCVKCHRLKTMNENGWYKNLFSNADDLLN